MMETATTAATATAMTATTTCFSSNLQSRRIYKIGVIVVVVFVWRCYFAIGLLSDDDGGGGDGHEFVSVYFVKKAIIHCCLSVERFMCFMFYAIHTHALLIFSLSVSLALSTILCICPFIGACACACACVRTCVHVCVHCCSNPNGSAFSTSPGLRIFAPI